jgi:phosphatidylserine decarboxylase
MPVARESYPYLVAGISVGTVALFLGFPWLGGAALALSGFVAYFFRDPIREIPGGAGVVVSPGDGKVTEVRSLGPSGGTRISIFLSLFDVHINRSPVAGRIERVDYREGRFLPANLARASLENERNDITLSTDLGRVRLSQIAGVVARRIVCWKKEGDEVAAGERIGLIQFGSRLEVELPPGVAPEVSPGARVKGGSTVLAVARQPALPQEELLAQESRR